MKALQLGPLICHIRALYLIANSKNVENFLFCRIRAI
jgi:hypothetical protein